MWVTLPLLLMKAEETVQPPAKLAFNRLKEGETAATHRARSQALQALIQSAGLKHPTKAFTSIGDMAVVDGAPLPDAATVFARIVIVALCKAPFFVRDQPDAIQGEPFIDVLNIEGRPETAEPSSPTIVPVDDDPVGVGRRVGMWPMPGGVRGYKSTADHILGLVAVTEMTQEVLVEAIAEQFDTKGGQSTVGYVRVLQYLGLVDVSDKVRLTSIGRAYLDAPSSRAMFDRIDATYAAFLACLVSAELDGVLGKLNARTRLNHLLGSDWKSDNQPGFRRNWLLSLGMVERVQKGDVLTDAGRAVLAERREHADALAALLQASSDSGDVEHAGVSEGDESESQATATSRLVLEAPHVARHLGSLDLPKGTLQQACAALTAGKLLLLVGPPGTGKTELAVALAAGAESEEYTTGLFASTASADWSTYDTIGGYALTKERELEFRSGAMLAALGKDQWLLIDEINRADMDKAMG